MPFRITPPAARAAVAVPVAAVAADGPRNLMRRKLMLAVPSSALFLSPVLLAGCGGGDDGVTADAQRIRGTLSLPAGVSAADISIVSNGSEAPADSASAFSADTLDGGLSLVSALHANGKLVLLGFFKPGASGQSLDARSSAAALLFMALDGWQLGAADRARLHDAIAADTATTTLTTRIGTQLAADPFALDGADVDVLAGVAGALSSLRAKPAAARMRTLAAGRARALADGDVQPLLRIEPGGEVDGIAVNQSGESPGYAITNNKRRRGIAHLYKVAYTPTGGERFDLALAEPVGEGLEVPSTQSLSVFSALADIINNTAPWSPVTTARVALSMQPGAEETDYEIVYVTPVYDRPPPAFFDDVRFAVARRVWEAELADMFEQAQMELVFGAVLEALGFGGIAVTSALYTQAIAALRASATSDVLLLLQQARNGTALLPSIRTFLVGMTSGQFSIVSGGIRESLATFIAPAEAQFAANLRAGTISRLRLAATNAALRVLLGVSVVAGVFDTAALYKDLHEGEEARLFTATLVAPKVLISPSSGKVPKGGQQTLTARVTGAQGLTLGYRWSLAGSDLANLQDTDGHLGRAFDSDRDSVVLATTPSTQGTLTVTVEVFGRNGDGTTTSLGKADAALEMDDTQVLLSPAEASIARVGGSQPFSVSVTAPPVDSTLSYEWTCASQYGSLTAGSQTTSATQPTITDPSTTATYAGRDGNDGGEIETLKVTAYYTRPDPNTGEPVRVDVGSASATVTIRQLFNIQLLPPSADVPTDSTLGVNAKLIETLPSGARVTWRWTHSGVGSIANITGDADKPTSSITFDSGSAEGDGFVTVEATVEVAGSAPVRVLVRPVSGVLHVAKGLKTETVSGSWTTEVLTSDNGNGGTSYSVIAYAIVPKVSGYTGCAVQITSSDPYISKDRSFGPNVYVGNDPNQSVQDRGGAFYLGLSGASGTIGNDGSGPGDAQSYFAGRFGDLTLTATYTLAS